MKDLRRLLSAVGLTLVLALSVSAGDIHTGVTSPPPPPPASMTAQGQIDTPAASEDSIADGEETAVAASVTEAALNLLQSVLSLF